jgi:hypothetical protein
MLLCNIIYNLLSVLSTKLAILTFIYKGTPALANHVQTATVNPGCNSYTIDLFAASLSPGTVYTLTWTITYLPVLATLRGRLGGPTTTITDSTTFTATQSSFDTGPITKMVGLGGMAAPSRPHYINSMKTLHELEPWACRWPIANVTLPGRRQGSQHLFCGEPTAPGKPYCRKHTARAFGRPGRDNQATPDNRPKKPESRSRPRRFLELMPAGAVWPSPRWRSPAGAEAGK